MGPIAWQVVPSLHRSHRSSRQVAAEHGADGNDDIGCLACQLSSPITSKGGSAGAYARDQTSTALQLVGVISETISWVSSLTMR